ncbi:MAG: hypothetical protein M1376_04925 [Planctomycetes bacterium]|nr:hypothetical protein [Planctomycetota bacterium]
MSKSKTGNTDYDLLQDDVLANLRQIADDPEVAAAHKLCERLKAALRETIGKLQHCSDPGPVGPMMRRDPSADAELLLSGTPASDLVAPVAESDYASLRRQLAALERAVPAADDRRREVFFTACNRELSRLRPTLAEHYEGVLSAFEALHIELRRYHELLTAILAHGMYYEILGPWNATPLENQILHGGPLCMSAELYLKTRREAMGLDNEAKK